MLAYTSWYREVTWELELSSPSKGASSWVAAARVATGFHGLLSASCFLQQAQAIWPGLPQYRQSLFLKRQSFSSAVSFPKGLGHWGTAPLICGSSVTRLQFLAGGGGCGPWGF